MMATTLCDQGSQGSTQNAEPANEADGKWRDVQLRYKLAPTSFNNLLAVPKAPSRQDILRQACFCTEFAAFPIDSAEKTFFREINDHCPIPYRITEAIILPWQKVFLLVQIDLARCVWPNKLSAAARKRLHSERGSLYRVLDQVLRCLVDILGQKLDGSGVIAALDVLRSVKAGVWEGNNMDLLQVDGIGPAKARTLVEAGIKTVPQLSKLEFYHIERLLHRNPPFGQQLLHQVAGFPRLHLDVHSIKAPTNEENNVARPSAQAKLPVLQLALRYENDELPVWDKKSPWVTLVVSGRDGRLLWFWRGSIKRLSGGKDLLIQVNANDQENLQVSFACESIVGTMQRKEVSVPSGN
jgi:ATP-dependent DNA helicase HFM1/MER3